MIFAIIICSFSLLQANPHSLRIPSFWRRHHNPICSVSWVRKYGHPFDLGLDSLGQTVAFRRWTVQITAGSRLCNFAAMNGGMCIDQYLYTSPQSLTRSQGKGIEHHPLPSNAKRRPIIKYLDCSPTIGLTGRLSYVACRNLPLAMAGMLNERPRAYFRYLL